MSDVVLTALIVSVPPTLVALAALIKIFKVHKELNSRLTEWKAETAKATIASNAASKAEGVREGEGKS